MKLKDPAVYRRFPVDTLRESPKYVPIDIEESNELVSSAGALINNQD